MTGSAPLVWIDGIPGESPVYLFRDPRAVVRAQTPAEVPRALGELDQALGDGRYVAGYVQYEAFAPVLRKNEAGQDMISAPGPVLWFGVFDRPEAAGRPAEIDALIRARDAYSLESVAVDEASCRERFEAAVVRIREEIAAGNVYQVNYTQAREYRFSGDPLALYALLRELQPAAYRACVLHDERALLSCSPELFVELREGPEGAALLETRPIKGTAPRGVHPAADTRIVEALRNDAKNRAENAMIVDLLRNDLGVHAVPGSVQASDLFQIQTLSTLHQMYSVITGRIAAEKRGAFFEKVWPDLFPCGSITGAPRRAARLMIRLLESGPRGVYTGSIGWCGPGATENATTRGGDATSEPFGAFNVAIRTLEVDRQRGRARFGSGCGVVWDSSPAGEWREAELKRSFLAPALDDFQIFTTLRYEGGRVVFAREHLLRLRRAARHFRFPFSRDALRTALRLAPPLDVSRAWRVRIALDRNGVFSIASTPLEEGFGRGLRRIRVALAEEPVFAGSPFRSRKTTERALYDRELGRVRATGFDDALFLNERDEVVETSTSNLVVLTEAGRWVTPGAESGALPGIYLDRLMRRAGRIVVETLSLEDLRRARVVLACNAVRGLRRVILPEFRRPCTGSQE